MYIRTVHINIEFKAKSNKVISVLAQTQVQMASKAFWAGTAYPSGASEFTPVFSGVRVTRSLVLYVCFVDHYLSFCTFSFCHCVVCSSVFWSLCCLFFCLLVIVLSVLLSFGHCVVCSSVFWPLCCLFFDIQILINPLVSSNPSYMTALFHLNGRFGPIRLVQPCHFWLRCLFQARWVNDHV